MSAKQNIGILVAEPSPPVANIIAKILLDNGYRKVAYSVDPDEIFMILKRRETDIALLDFNLAVANKFELLDRIATDSELYHLPMVLMGKGVSVGMIDEALRLGGRDYLTKPFTPYLLMVRLEKILFGPRKPIRRPIFKDQSIAGPDAHHEELPKRSENAEKQKALAEKLYLDGKNFLELRKYDKAIAKFAAAARINILYPEAYEGLAEAFRRQGNLERWGQFMAKAAETYAWLEKDDEAAETYTRARKADPSAANPFKTVADHMAQQDDNRELLRLYKHAVKLDPDNDAARLGLVQAYLNDGQKEEAAKTLAPISSREDVPENLKGLVGQVRRRAARPNVSTGNSIGFIEGGGEYLGEEKRRAERIPLAEYAARLPQREHNFHIVDASSLGIGFKHGGEKFEIGEELYFDLLTLEGTKVRKVAAVVRRITPLIVGCELLSLTPKQREQFGTIVPLGD